MKRTTASGSSGGAYVDYVAGITAGTLLTAEDRNNIQEEICHLIEAVGWSLDGTDQYQLDRSMRASSKVVGELLMPEIKLTPIILSASKSTTNPGNPYYLPIIDRTDADHDVTTSQAPDLVTAYRAYAATVAGSASFTATVSGSVLTFANTTANNALIAMVLADALVQRWFSSSQSATFDGSGPDYSNGRCINVAGADFAITAVSIGSRTITVSGSPTTGSQTVIFYPYRIAGSSTSVRLHRLSGFVPVIGGDADAFEISGMRHMDSMQGHWHNGYSTGTTNVGSTGRNWISADATANNTLAANTWIKEAATDGTNGTPRTGKTTSPRSHARFCYSWAGRLLA
jgi:hypothetical protein